MTTLVEEQIKPELSFLAGGGEVGARIRAFDWSRTPLGSAASWPQSLKTSISLMLGSQHPIWIGWGHEFTFLYNDAYRSVLGAAKDKWALGCPAQQVWSEIWEICGPLANKVRDQGEASFLNDVRLFMRRGDFLEETFYSFSYSPIRDETGSVVGLFCPSSDVTAKNLNARRLSTLSDLAARSLIEKSPQAAVATAAKILAKNPDDIPFALIYIVDDSTHRAVLEQSAPPLQDPHLAPPFIDLSNSGSPWPIAEVLKNPHPLQIPVADLKFALTGAAQQPLAEAIVLPLSARGQEQPFGAIVAGINPTCRLDSEYQTFFTLAAAQIATAITNARAAEEERRRIEALAELDRAKTTFFSNVSHEFRTPLTLMIGPIEEELRRSGGNDNLELARRNSLRLLKLVNALLDFSRVEAGRIQAHYEPTDLAALTATLATVFRPAAEKAGLKLIIDCPPLPEPVYVDREMWEKLVMNLLSNAFKFTFQGEIRLTLRWAGKNVELSVADTGVGIPEQELANVFRRFHRVRGSRSRTHEGTGIGLALVKELANVHSGEALVTSKLGAGSTFTITVQTGKEHLPPEAIGAGSESSAGSTRAEVFVDEAMRWLPDGEIERSPFAQDLATLPPAQTPVKPAPADAPRILIADDNADMRNYMRRLLENEYRVETVVDGQAALDSVKANPPDLVLTDVMMPRLDGFGLLDQIRSDQRTRALPVIMLSARAGEEARDEGLGSGADEYLAKPFSARELLARIRSQLKMSRLRREGEERVSGILESIADSFLVIDAGWRITFLNPAARNMLAGQGADPARVIGKHMWNEVFTPALGTTGEKLLRRVMTERVALDFEEFYAHWQKWFSVRAYPVEDGGLAIYARDITDRKESENLVRVAEKRFRNMADSAAVLIWQTDARGIAFVNREYLQFFGVPAENVAGQDWGIFIHPDDKAGFINSYQIAFERQYTFEFVCRVRRHDGEYRWLRSIARPTQDEHGKFAGFIGCSFDVTAVKLAEEERKQVQQILERTVADRTAKLRETVGELEAFSYSIAHDMRAPLRSLQGFSQFLAEEYSDKLDDTAQGYLRRISNSAERMDRLIQDVLNYSKIVRAELPMEAVEIEALLRSIIESYPALQKEDATIEIDNALPRVIGNEAGLTQCLSNLLGNAVKFVAKGVRPHVRIWAEKRDALVRLYIADNGIGIALDQQEKIFAMFQRVSKDYDGTGIGLAIVRKAMERMNGRVGVISEPGKGSTFWIELHEASAPRPN